MQTRDRIIQAEDLAEQDKYADAIDLLQPITPETTHFKDVRDLIDQFQMELDALNRVNAAQEKAAKGRYSEAIAILKDVNIKSKRYKLSRQRIASYRAALAKLSPKHKAK
jgi:predicted Zn-dependent protease